VNAINPRQYLAIYSGCEFCPSMRQAQVAWVRLDAAAPLVVAPVLIVENETHAG
jgi:hypothetical protein